MLVIPHHSEVLRDLFRDVACVVIGKFAILISLISLVLLKHLPKFINLVLPIEDWIVVLVSLKDIALPKRKMARMNSNTMVLGFAPSTYEFPISFLFAEV